MKYQLKFLAAGIFLTTTLASFCQPTISRFQLSGQPVTAKDDQHDYFSFSVSPGADVILKVYASGTPAIFHYQWQFNHSDLPGQNGSSLNFPSVQLTNAGEYTVVVTNASGSVTGQVTLTVDPTFTKIITGAIVTEVAYPSGGTWGDYNNDGFLDLFVANGEDGNSYYDFLYRNNGNGTFTKVTNGPPVNVLAESSSACWGDYDNDGNLDLFVTTTGTTDLLYHNNGDGSFTRITNGSPVRGLGAALDGSAWADYDNDGFLDLFVTVFDPAANSHNYLFRNNGNGTFSSITNSVLVADRGSSLGCVWGDYDNDGKLDLFVCGGRGPGLGLQPNRLYHNNGNGTFTRISTGSIATDASYSGGAAWADYDNDGFLDLFVVNAAGVKNFLYHNNGDGTFNRITNDIVAFDVGNGYSCGWGDYDNDGFLDLFVTNEGVPNAVNFLYHNNGNGTFAKITNGSPVSEESDSWGFSWGDYDNDGFLDLFVTRGDGRGNYLYRNNGNSNSWLAVKLIGTVSNRSAVGAKVRVKTTVGGVSHSQLRQTSGGSGWVGHNELWANFGLGNATNIDLVRIEWPSGTVQTMTNVATNQFLTVTEPPRLLASKTNGEPQFSIKGRRGSDYQVDTSTNLTTWSSLGTVTITNQNGTARIIETNTPAAAQRFYRAVSR